MNLEKQLYFTRRYNKIILKWASENTKDTEDILKDVTRIIYRYRDLFEDEESLDRFYRFLENTTSQQVKSFLTIGQIESKKWIIQKLKDLEINDIGKVHILGGWYGLMAHMILNDSFFNYEHIRSFDIDKNTISTADLLNKKWVNNNWKFKAVHCDMFKLNYELTDYTIINDNNEKVKIQESSDLLINTSCEHINFKEWMKKIPMNKLVILQSNNFFSEDTHISCYEDLDKFEKDANLQIIYFKGTLKLEDYDRYMLIGRT